MNNPDPPKPLDLDAVTRVAHLARLSPSDDDLEAYRSQLAAILEHMRSLQALDLDDVEPLTHPAPTQAPLDDDTPRDPLPHQTLMDMAPDAAPPFIKVPKVIDSAHP